MEYALKFNEFLDKVNYECSTINQGVIWYRGHSNSSYKLLPTIMRHSSQLNEAGLFYDYKSHAAGINNENKEDWELLLDMQHYGLPTRMLDWTTSLGTAMYFALKGNPTSPCIWIINPFSISLESTGQGTIFDVSVMNYKNANLNTSYNLYHLITNQSTFIKPFSIQPPHGNKRIAAQRGMFTVHGSSTDSIEEQCPQYVKKIDIPLELIEPIKKYLENLGIDDFSLFPDQYGLSQHLKIKHGI